MATKFKIKIDPSLRLFTGTILEAEKPDASTLREHIIGICLNDDDGINMEVLKPLVQAYIAQATYEFDEEERGREVQLVSDHDDYAAEKLYRKYSIKGWREAVRPEYPEYEKSCDDDAAYENCGWYEFGKMVWPAQLIAEVGYMLGYRSGRSGVQMTRHFESRKNG